MFSAPGNDEKNFKGRKRGSNDLGGISWRGQGEKKCDTEDRVE